MYYNIKDLHNNLLVAAKLINHHHEVIWASDVPYDIFETIKNIIECEKEALLKLETPDYNLGDLCKIMLQENVKINLIGNIYPKSVFTDQ